ncbi:MAG: rhomboid family intramembrane serine protease [Desulfobulbaceae bacterium]|nr:rhomboid family intramembrane serine protease [Desulfobulbaceae bacterium]
MKEQFEPTHDISPAVSYQDIDNLVPLDDYRANFEECSLVLCAMGIMHRIDNTDGHIYVEKRDVLAAHHQLELYFSENIKQVEESPLTVLHQSPPLPTILACQIMSLFYLVTGPFEAKNPWFLHGANNGFAVIQQDQWYRCLTSLTLHADSAHLLGNCFIGGFLIHLLCSHIGFGTGWLLVVISGVMGNAINIWVHPPSHISVGLSTAVFGAIGIMTGMQMLHNIVRKSGRFIISLGAGLSLLAMLGSSGERTDLGAHLFGLLFGIALGFIYNLFPTINRTLQSTWAQSCCYTVTFSSILWAWHLALYANP